MKLRKIIILMLGFWAFNIQYGMAASDTVSVGLDCSGVVMYSISNFTPYQINLKKADNSWNKTAVLANGFPTSIEPMLAESNGVNTGFSNCVSSGNVNSRGSSSARIFVIYTESGDELWQPQYQIIMNTDNLIINKPLELTVKNSVKLNSGTRTMASTFENKADSQAVFSKIYNAYKKNMDAGMADIDNNSRQSNNTVNYVYRLKTLAAVEENSKRIDKTEDNCAEVLAGGVDYGGYVVIQTIALESPLSLMLDDRGYAGGVNIHEQTELQGNCLAVGGAARVLINVYTYAQYCAGRAAAVADKVHAWDSDEEKLLTEIKGNGSVSDTTSFFNKMVNMKDENCNKVLMAVESMDDNMDDDGLMTAGELEKSRLTLDNNSSGSDIFDSPESLTMNLNFAVNSYGIDVHNSNDSIISEALTILDKTSSETDGISSIFDNGNLFSGNVLADDGLYSSDRLDSMWR